MAQDEAPQSDAASQVCSETQQAAELSVSVES